jgi:CO/xanthine dehydrogenase FAD-binding subunit
MAKFTYFEPADLAEALSLLQKYGDEGGYGNAFYATGVRIKDLPLLPHNGLTHLAGRGLL